MNEHVFIGPYTDRGELVIVAYDGDPCITTAKIVAKAFMAKRHGKDWFETWTLVGANIDRERRPCRTCGRPYNPHKVIEFMYVRATHLSLEDIAERILAEGLEGL